MSQSCRFVEGGGDCIVDDERVEQAHHLFAVGRGAGQAGNKTAYGIGGEDVLESNIKAAQFVGEVIGDEGVEWLQLDLFASAHHFAQVGIALGELELKLRLADEDDAEQAAHPVLQLPEALEVLEHRHGEVVRLVNDETVLVTGAAALGQQTLDLPRLGLH